MIWSFEDPSLEHHEASFRYQCTITIDKIIPLSLYFLSFFSFFLEEDVSCCPSILVTILRWSLSLSLTCFRRCHDERRTGDNLENNKKRIIASHHPRSLSLYCWEALTHMCTCTKTRAFIAKYDETAIMNADSTSQRFAKIWIDVSTSCCRESGPIGFLSGISDVYTID